MDVGPCEEVYEMCRYVDSTGRRWCKLLTYGGGPSGGYLVPRSPFKDGDQYEVHSWNMNWFESMTTKHLKNSVLCVGQSDGLVGVLLKSK